MRFLGRAFGFVWRRLYAYVLLLAAVPVLFIIGDGEHRWREFWLGLSCEFAGAIAAGVLILSILGVRDHVRLDVDEFCRRVARARTCVHVVDIWMKTILLTKGYREQFEWALRQACRNGVEKVRFVVVDPDCRAARKRAEQLKGTHGFPDDPELVLAMMRQCVEILKEIKITLCATQPRTMVEWVFGRKQARFAPDQVQIAFLAEAPTLAVHEADGFAYFAFFPASSVSAGAAQIGANEYEAGVGTLFAQFHEIVRSATLIEC